MVCRAAGRVTDGETVGRKYYNRVRRVSRLYDSKISIHNHNIPYIHLHASQKDGMTPGCSVAASLLLVTHKMNNW